MDIELIKLRSGSGNGDPRDGLCLMQAVHWFSGAECLSDRPECTSPVLCALGIRLNDIAPTQAHRDQLWPLVWQLLDSRDPGAERRRTEYIVREVTHRLVAPVFEARFPRHAAALRAAHSIPEIKAAAEAAAAWVRCAVAATEAWAAKSLAAATVAAAAVVAAEAVAEGAEAVAEEAETVAEVAGSGGAEVWGELRQIFIETIALGKHGEEDPIYAPRAAELIRVLALSE